ncbi:hypothetical protein N7451_012903 [Penicillium sp. IBT 35674x]|nr:hypothetical protein N7451_012903 [Penicillium sp. IBT 35674x]
MHRPDDEFINQFRERFGDLLLSCHVERRTTAAHTDVGDPMVYGYVKENGHISNEWEDKADLNPPMTSAKKYEPFLDRNLPVSGAVFHSEAGDLHSPMIWWNTNISLHLGGSIQHASQISSNGPHCFTPRAKSQHFLYDNTCFGRTNDIARTLMRHGSGYTRMDKTNQDILPDSLSEHSDSDFELARVKGHVNDHRQYGKGEKYA